MWATHLRILGFCATRQDTGTRETRKPGKHQARETARVAGSEAHQSPLPVIISTFLLFCIVYNVSGVSGVIRRCLLVVVQIHHDVLDLCSTNPSRSPGPCGAAASHCGVVFFLMSFCPRNFSFSFRIFTQILFPLFVFDFCKYM